MCIHQEFQNLCGFILLVHNLQTSQGINMTRFVSLIFILWLRLYLKKFQVYFLVGSEVYIRSMKESPGPWSPVAVFHSYTSCCMFGTMGIVLKMRAGGLLRGPGHCEPWGNLSSDVLHSVPRVTGTLMADWT